VSTNPVPSFRGNHEQEAGHAVSGDAPAAMADLAQSPLAPTSLL